MDYSNHGNLYELRYEQVRRPITTKLGEYTRQGYLILDGRVRSRVKMKNKASSRRIKNAPPITQQHGNPALARDGVPRSRPTRQPSVVCLSNRCVWCGSRPRLVITVSGQRRAEIQDYVKQTDKGVNKKTDELADSLQKKLYCSHCGPRVFFASRKNRAAVLPLYKNRCRPCQETKENVT